ncbi:MAG: NlpC/P60 family protein [Gordonibacter sp.]
MQEQTPALSRRTFVGGAAAVGALSLAFPTTALGVTAAEKQAEADAVRNQLVGLQAEVEAASELYHGALDQRNAAQAAMEAEQAKIDEATAQIANLQEQLGSRARGMYRSGSSTFIDFLLGSSTFAQFTQNWDILNNLNENDAQMVNTTKELRESVEASKAEYTKQEKIAADRAAEAKKNKDETEAKVAQAGTLMNSLSAEARELLEQEQAAAAAAAAAQKQAEMEAARPSGGNSSGGGGGSTGTGGDDTGGGGGTGNGIEVPSQGSVVSYALSRIGCPYIYGDEGPNSFDCSGLVTWAYRQVGIELPHQDVAQRNAARQIVSVAEARPGDVLWRYGHVGIAVGYGGMPYVHAPTPGALVRDTDDLNWSQFTHALRF